MLETILNDNDVEMMHLQIKRASDPKFIFPGDVGIYHSCLQVRMAK